jgi:hypothetical protein
MGIYNMTAYNGSSPIPDGVWQGAYVFDGVNDYLSSNTNISSSRASPFSVSIWFKGNMTTDYGGIFALGNTTTVAGKEHHGIELVIFGDYCVVIIGSTTQTTYAKCNDGVWTHSVLSYNGTTLRWWINGALANSYTISPLNISIPSTAIRIGKSFYYEKYLYQPINQVYNGSIDEFMFFNRSLTDSEVASLFYYGNYNWNFTGSNTYDSLSSLQTSTNKSVNMTNSTTHLLLEMNMTGTNYSSGYKAIPYVYRDMNITAYGVLTTPATIGGASSPVFGSINNTIYICNEIYSFVIQNTNLSGTNFDISKISTLAYNLYKNKGINISEEDLIHIIYNYDSICTSLVNKTLPILNFTTCSYSVNKLFDLGIGRFPLPSFQIPDIDCSTISILKYIFSFEKDLNNLKINGIRLYIIVLILVICIYFTYKPLKNKLRKSLNTKNGKVMYD